MMGDKLKPCPFCRGGDVGVEGWGYNVAVVCHLCNAQGTVIDTSAEGGEYAPAIAAWNRAPRKRKAARPKRKAVEAAVDVVIRAAQTEGYEEGARGTSFTFFSFINPGVTRRARADLLALLGYGSKGGDA